jgi:hypothetical protein
MATGNRWRTSTPPENSTPRMGTTRRSRFLRRSCGQMHTALEEVGRYSPTCIVFLAFLFLALHLLPHPLLALLHDVSPPPRNDEAGARQVAIAGVQAAPSSSAAVARLLLPTAFCSQSARRGSGRRHRSTSRQPSS